MQNKTRVKRDEIGRRWAVCPKCHLRGEFHHLGQHENYVFQCQEDISHDIRGEIHGVNFIYTHLDNESNQLLTLNPCPLG